MPPVEAPTVSKEVQNESESISKPLVGIIYPPPEVRNIVDKTASFVARNGPSFEERIKANEINNPKFNFLTPTDPYHAYYQHKVKEFSEGKAQEAPPPSFRPSAIPRTQEVVKILQEPVLPKEPPPEPEFICDPPSISAFDLDVVKLTAQFVARNGRQFLTNLMNKEQRNYQFDFLRPQHSLFNYFTKLVEQYTKVMIPPKDLMHKLKKDSEDSKEILNQVQYRVLWAKHQELEKKKEEDAKEKERVAYAQIDWHDFVVVETVDYQPNEIGMFPTPTTPDEVGARILMQERMDNDSDMPEKAPPPPPVRPVAVVEKTAEARVETEDDVEMELSDKEDEAQDMEEGSDEEQGMAPPKLAPQPTMPGPPTQPSLPMNADQLIIRQYDPKIVKPAPVGPQTEQYLISPLTGEKIPAHKLQEHMKISLLDPKWREQKERQIREKKEAETVYDAGINIKEHLERIAERRTDIFGTGIEETEIGKKIGEEEDRKLEKMVWDGHTASMEKVSQKARENISIEEQIKVIHQTKGLIEDESKSKIGPAVTKATPVQPPSSSAVITSMKAPTMTTLPAGLSIIQTPVAGIPRPVAPVPVPPPSAPIIQLRPPQGVQAPPMVIPARPPGVVVMPAARPTTAIPIPVPARPIIGVPIGTPMAPMAPVQPMMRPFLAPAPVAVGPVTAVSAVPASMLDDEPPNKKAKTEDNLIPEDHWIAQRPGPVTVIIQVPAMPDKPEWNLNGQALQFTFAPTEPCGSIKQKIADLLNMPVGKQKLQYEGMFIKDNNSLAFYNFMSESVVQLSTKERGGRKK